MYTMKKKSYRNMSSRGALATKDLGSIYFVFPRFFGQGPQQLVFTHFVLL